MDFDSKSRAKIEDVAKAANVSIMSVSRAMRGVEGLSRKKRAEILKIARNIGYEPSSIAGSLAAANSTLIGVSVPTLDDEVFGEIFNGIRPVLNSSGFQTIFDTTEYQTQREVNWIERMIAWRPAGIILSGVDHSNKARKILLNSGIPTLELWDYSTNPIDLCVGVDHYLAGKTMAEYLLSLGYQKPAYIGVEYQRDSRAEKRLDGFQDAFAMAGHTLSASIRLEDSVSFEAGKQGVTQVFEQAKKMPDILYFLNDHLALGGMLECERRGLSVPKHIGIVGFNGLNINNVLEKPITTSITPRRAMGAKAASLLVARIRNAATESSIALDTELFQGATTRQMR